MRDNSQPDKAFHYALGHALDLQHVPVPAGENVVQAVGDVSPKGALRRFRRADAGLGRSRKRVLRCTGCACKEVLAASSSTLQAVQDRFQALVAALGITPWLPVRYAGGRSSLLYLLFRPLLF